VAIVGTDGLVKERYAYDAFGNVHFLTPNYASRSASDYGWEFLFHNEFPDSESKLYNYGYRYYDAGLGRWLSKDPIGEDDGFNLYLMVQNCPLSSDDYLGLRGCGPGLIGDWFVPDKPGPADFGAPCDQHDLCYSTCNATQSACDNAFRKELEKSCKGLSTEPAIGYISSMGSNGGAPPIPVKGKSPYERCMWWANKYATFIEHYGNIAFNHHKSKEARAADCCSKKISNREH
jgi:RHS repeat-associated protein